MQDFDTLHKSVSNPIMQVMDWMEHTGLQCPDSWLFSKLFLRVSGAEWIAVRQPASYMGFIQWSVKQLCICFKGNGVGERKRKFVHHSLVFFNHCLHACQPACVCVFFFFWSNHVWCLRPNDPCCLFRKHETGLELNQPFVWPYKTSLPAWQSTEHRLSPIDKTESEWGWKQVLLERWGGQFLMHCWFLTDHKSNCKDC